MIAGISPGLFVLASTQPRDRGRFCRQDYRAPGLDLFDDATAREFDARRTLTSEQGAVDQRVGDKLKVRPLHAATHLLVSVVTSDYVTPAPAIVPVDTSWISSRLLPVFLQANHEATFDHVVVSDANIVRAGDRSFDDALAVARVVTAAYRVGGMVEILEMSVTH